MTKDETIKDLLDRINILTFGLREYISRSPHVYVINGAAFTQKTAIDVLKELKQSSHIIVSKGIDINDRLIEDVDLRIDVGIVTEKANEIRALQDQYYKLVTDYKIITKDQQTF